MTTQSPAGDNGDSGTQPPGGQALTGAALRQLRLQAGLGVRTVARRAGGKLSDSHLSRVENGQRPVSPAVVAVYERALGVRISEIDGAPQVNSDELVRQSYNSMLAAVAVGGPLGEPLDRLITTSLIMPGRVGAADVTALESATGMLRTLDLRFGGGIAGTLGDRLVHCAVALRAGSTSDQLRMRLHAAVGAAALWTGWCHLDQERHNAARRLFAVALEAAVAADLPDLRAHVLAEVAAAYNHLGLPEDCLTILRIADGDERTSAAIRCLLHGVRARARADRGERAACLQQVEYAAATSATVHLESVPGWMGGWEPAHTEAACGHALAALADHSLSDDDLTDADKRLRHAAEQLTPAGRTRAAALCHSRLARLHERAGNTSEATAWGQQAAGHTSIICSARLANDVARSRQRRHGAPFNAHRALRRGEHSDSDSTGVAVNPATWGRPDRSQQHQPNAKSPLGATDHTPPPEWTVPITPARRPDWEANP